MARVRSARVSWVPPTNSGTGTLTGYSVTSIPGNGQPFTAPAEAADLEFTGLTNGQTYQFAVVAMTDVGFSAPALSSEVRTPDVPSAPSSVTAITSGVLSALLMWLPPSTNGGAPITSYVITQSADGGTTTVAADVLSTLITDLPRAPQSFRIRAVNAVGSGPDSSPSSQVVPLSLPTAPRGVLASSGNGRGTVRWLAPLDSGGLIVSGYVVTASPGGASVTTNGTTTRATVSALTNGTRYTFTVVAQNALGASTRSLPSKAIIPALPCSGSSRLGGLPGVSVGSFPSTASVADFDGDGRPDVAVASRSANGVSVLRGRADATFSPAINFSPPGASPAALAPGDFNADGHVDLALATSGVDLSIHFGNGTGTFGPGTQYAAARERTAVVVGDFNQDGSPDLAVAGNSILDPNPIAIWLGSAAGSFTQGFSRLLLRDSIDMIAVDLTGDGRLDLASASQNGEVHVFEGQADAGLLPEVTYYSAGTRAASIRGSDLNRDGHVDLVVAGNNMVTVLTNTGNGTFPPFNVPYTLAAPAAGAVDLVDADFDGDGDLDLVVASRGSDDVTVFLGDGSGALSLAGTYAVHSWPTTMATADFNGDGRPDLAVATAVPSGSVKIIVNLGDGGFLAPVDVPAGSTPVSLVSADFNRDGRADLAFANHDGNSLGVALANANSTFRASVSQAIGSKPIAVELGDLNADGWSDVAVASSGGDRVSVLLGTASGALGLAGSWDAGPSPSAIVSGDFDGDGLSDLVVANRPSASVTLLTQTTSGTFLTAASLVVAAPPVSLATGDFDVDGRLDLAVATQTGVSVLLNRAAGFVAASYSTGSGPSAVRAGDLDEDGHLDLVVANAPGDSISLLKARSDGTFAGAVTLATGPDPVALELEDVDADGHLDVVLVHQSQDLLSIMFGVGDGTFLAPIAHPTRGGPRGVTVGDLNGDGRLDVAAASSSSNTVSVIPILCMP